MPSKRSRQHKKRRQVAEAVDRLAGKGTWDDGPVSIKDVHFTGGLKATAAEMNKAFRDLVKVARSEMPTASPMSHMRAAAVTISIDGTDPIQTLKETQYDPAVPGAERITMVLDGEVVDIRLAEPDPVTDAAKRLDGSHDETYVILTGRHKGQTVVAQRGQA